jgi:hypothetical protein
MLKRFFTSEGWLRNRLLYKLGLAYILALVVVCVASFEIHPLFTLSLDTVRAILSTVMGVSGSILGFLVIYLTLALESIRKYFGRHAIAIFRRDPVIWILCIFFSYVIILSLLAFCIVDQPGWWLTFLFNLSCLSFVLGIALTIPMGIIILNRTDTAIRIKYLLDAIQVTDFRPRPQNDAFFSTSFWIVTEDPQNTVDRYTAILLHNIGEGNTRIVAAMLRSFYSRMEEMVDQHKGEGDIEEVVMRFYDILLMAFDQVKSSGDEVIIKLIFSGLYPGSNLAATKQMGAPVINYIFKSARTAIQYLIEHENEQLAYEGLWRYYHMVRPQAQHNLPPESEKEKYVAVQNTMVHDYDKLIERSFQCANKYITANAVRMHVYLLDMLIRDVDGWSVEKTEIAKMISWDASEHIIQWADKEKGTQGGYMSYYLHGEGLVTALKSDTSLALILVMDYCKVLLFLLDNGYWNNYDLEGLTSLGELILKTAADLTDMIKHILAVSGSARSKLTELLKTVTHPKVYDRLKRDLTIAQEGAAKWLALYYELGLQLPDLEDYLKIFQNPPPPASPIPAPPDPTTAAGATPAPDPTNPAGGTSAPDSTTPAGATPAPDGV